MIVEDRRGITLISLVVTIIVLLLLSAITIQMTLGKDGLLNKTSIAKEESDYNRALEEVKMIVVKAGVEANTKKKDLEVSDVIEELKKESGYTYTVLGEKLNVKHLGYEFEIGKDLSIKAIGRNGNEVVLAGIVNEEVTPAEEEDDSPIAVGEEISDELLEDSSYDQTTNIFDYSQGARVTYLTNPYSAGNRIETNRRIYCFRFSKSEVVIIFGGIVMDGMHKVVLKMMQV